MKFPVLWLSFVSEFMGGSRGDIPCMGLSVPFAYHLALRCKSCKNKNKTIVSSILWRDKETLTLFVKRRRCYPRCCVLIYSLKQRRSQLGVDISKSLWCMRHVSGNQCRNRFKSEKLLTAGANEMNEILYANLVHV